MLPSTHFHYMPEAPRPWLCASRSTGSGDSAIRSISDKGNPRFRNGFANCSTKTR